MDCTKFHLIGIQNHNNLYKSNVNFFNMEINKYLEGKNILITGSSRGIGAATAKLAKEYGANVILHGKTESEKLKQLSKELNCKYQFYLWNIGNFISSNNLLLDTLSPQGN